MRIRAFDKLELLEHSSFLETRAFANSSFWENSSFEKLELRNLEPLITRHFENSNSRKLEFLENSSLSKREFSENPWKARDFENSSFGKARALEHSSFRSSELSKNAALENSTCRKLELGVYNLFPSYDSRFFGTRRRASQISAPPWPGLGPGSARARAQPGLSPDLGLSPGSAWSKPGPHGGAEICDARRLVPKIVESYEGDKLYIHM